MHNMLYSKYDNIPKNNNMKMRYWIISYVCVPPFNFQSESLLFPQILVIIRQSFRASLQMVCSVPQIPRLGTYP